MGNWNLTIKGCGMHHNKLPGDADRVGVEALKALRAAGSTVSEAKLTLTQSDGTPFLDHEENPSKYVTDLINLAAQDSE